MQTCVRPVDAVVGGIFADVGDLQRVAARMLSEAVDTLLDKPELRAALRRP